MTERRKRKNVERMITRTACPPPYEWLLPAIESYAAKNFLTRAVACCYLLRQGLDRDLEKLRVLRTFPVPRRRDGEADSALAGPDVPAFSVAANYVDIYDLFPRAVDTIKAMHVERAKAGLESILGAGLDKAVSVRGWRSLVRIDEKTRPGIVLEIAGGLKLSDGFVRDVCDVATDDMLASDVRRAMWATELEIAKYAPKGWSERSFVNRGRVSFEDPHGKKRSAAMKISQIMKDADG